MLRFPRICLTQRACLTIILALALATPTFLGSPTAARADITETNDPTRALLDCNNDDCAYLPAIISPGDSVQSRRTSGRSEAVALYQEMYLASNITDPDWTGTYSPCTPGATNNAFRDAVLLRVNYFRRMAGVPLLEGLRSDHNAAEQEAALMMSRNEALSHAPASSWACFTEPGREAAGKSNLALGAHGPSAIDLYMNDYGLSTLGHRRWLLYPQTRWAATGDIPGGDGYPATNAFRSYDENIWGPRPQTRDGFVAWPPPAYVPYTVVYAYWSFAYPGADFSRASVSVTQDGKALSVKQYPQTDGFGEPALVWSMEGMSQTWPRPSADTTYQVSIRGVRVGGQTRDFSYPVTVIDPSK